MSPIFINKALYTRVLIQIDADPKWIPQIQIASTSKSQIWIHMSYMLHLRKECNFYYIFNRNAIRMCHLLVHACIYALIIVLKSTGHAAVYAL